MFPLYPPIATTGCSSPPSYLFSRMLRSLFRGSLYLASTTGGRQAHVSWGASVQLLVPNTVVHLTHPFPLHHSLHHHSSTFRKPFPRTPDDQRMKIAGIASDSQHIRGVRKDFALDLSFRYVRPTRAGKCVPRRPGTLRYIFDVGRVDE
jgi:hypothetical protein